MHADGGLMRSLVPCLVLSPISADGQDYILTHYISADYRYFSSDLDTYLAVALSSYSLTVQAMLLLSRRYSSCHVACVDLTLSWLRDQVSTTAFVGSIPVALL